jgi:hypothetical protein
MSLTVHPGWTTYGTALTHFQSFRAPPSAMSKFQIEHPTHN